MQQVGPEVDELEYRRQDEESKKMKLYIGNLAYRTDDEALGNHFRSVGEVLSARVVTNREDGRSRGFGFVEMASEDAGNDAIEKLNGSSLDGRELRVSQAQEPKERSPRSGGGNRNGGGGYRGGGGGGHRGNGGGGGYRGGNRSHNSGGYDN